jgi:hypothetical protein
LNKKKTEIISFKIRSAIRVYIFSTLVQYS